ncbi:hypothetical protein SAMN04488089_10183 [Myroides profundi]|uniref:Uncharacterized protein n=1 Tax=Myroides profundi TaxID=480520 RepID=A0AAJ4W0U7_MYRPR|nr:hypothetical protein SAMN04488089_10183 [Myroides profundi]
MLDKVKYAAKLSFIGGSSFFKVYAVGSLSAVFSFTIGLLLFMGLITNLVIWVVRQV